ncbi:MAG: VWA domain-containing protein [Candidatus Methanomethylophilaceae archaeon]|nr:VWA domain-containing protein [Candidatus Methanomethylophilaceae archaeon]
MMGEELFDPLDAEPIARKRLVLFYLVDVSGSMRGEKIGIVNQVMEEVIPELRNIGGADSDIHLAVITFGEGCQWMYSEPVSVETFRWERLSADGMTPMGAAFRELNSKMSRSAFLSAPHLSFAPVVFMLTDGYPTDDYASGLEALKGNKWFRSSLKIALGIGEAFDSEVLESFTGNPELVLKATNGKRLAEAIRFASVTSSAVGSRSIGFDPSGEMSEESCRLKEQAFIDMKNDALGDEDEESDSGW